MFEYNLTILRVIDGDTVDAMVDLGFSVHRKIRIRMYGINTPESRTRDLEEKERGLKAKDRLVSLLETHEDTLVLKSFGVGKYGRCLGELFYSVTIEDEWTETKIEKKSINKQLITEGHAVQYFRGKR